METYSKQEEGKGLNLITYVEVKPAHESDAKALIPAIESVKNRNLQPEELLADANYGGDGNREKAKEFSVEVIAPLSGTHKGEGISLSEFKSEKKGKIISCLFGNIPSRIEIKDNRVSASFDKALCAVCPRLSGCPVKEGKNFYYLHFSKKQLRIENEGYLKRLKNLRIVTSGGPGSKAQCQAMIGVQVLRGFGLGG